MRSGGKGEEGVKVLCGEANKRREVMSGCGPS